MISVVSYDVWRTLIRANADYVTHRGMLIAQALQWPGDDLVVVEAVNNASSTLDKQTNATGVQYGFLDRVKHAANSLGLDLPSAERLAKLQTEVIQSHLERLPALTEPDLPAIFRAHRNQGRKIAIISNTGMTEGRTMSQILDALGLLEFVDFTLYSDELGIAKPDPKIFHSLARRSDVPVNNVLHIGDSNAADYEGARHAGLAALLYAPKNTPPGALARHSEVLTHPLLARS